MEGVWKRERLFKELRWISRREPLVFIDFRAQREGRSQVYISSREFGRRIVRVDWYVRIEEVLGG